MDWSYAGNGANIFYRRCYSDMYQGMGGIVFWRLGLDYCR
jgi:hypothetical protein